MSSFYKCSFFEESKITEKNFVVMQQEIIMSKILSDNKVSFSKKDVLYKCEFIKHKNFDSSKPTILIPIKDNMELLRYTVSNLYDTKVTNHTNIIVIDDRSEEDIKSVAVKNSLSYLRVDNEKGFNFSMLNNIAAKICQDLGVQQIILWNSDLWCIKEQFFVELLDRHNKSKSKISGSKLLYPPLEMSLNKEEDSKNIKSYFPRLLGGKWRKTVQFGGDDWVPQGLDKPIILSPDHKYRFSNHDNPIVNCDRGGLFVTGALQIWDLNFFIELGGLNPSLSKNFQDVDICLRAAEMGEYSMYFGKNIYFYHDESYTLNNVKGEKKHDHQLVSDHYLFGKIWNSKIVSVVYGTKQQEYREQTDESNIN